MGKGKGVGDASSALLMLSERIMLNKSMEYVGIAEQKQDR